MRAIRATIGGAPQPSQAIDDSEEPDIAAAPDEDAAPESEAQPPHDDDDTYANFQEVDGEIDIRQELQITPAQPIRRRFINSTSATIFATVISFLLYYFGLGTENLTFTTGGLVFTGAAAITAAIQRALASQSNAETALVRNDPMRASRNAGGSIHTLIEPSDPTGSATGIRVISIAISAGVATVTMYFFGGTLVTFGLTALGSHLAITRLSHPLLARLPIARLNQSLSYIRALGLRVEQFLFTEFVLRWLRQNNTGGYPAPLSAREALLRARLQDRGADVIAGMMGVFAIILTLPVSGAFWGASYGVFTYSALRSLILAYLFATRRVAVREIQNQLLSEGNTDYVHQANEIIRLGYALQTQFGGFLAMSSVVAERLFYVLRHIPFLLLTRLLPSSAQKVAMAVLGVNAAADTLALVHATVAIGEGETVPEDVVNVIIDHSPLVRLKRAAVYSTILIIIPIIALFVVVNFVLNVGTTNINVAMLIGSLVLLAILSIVIYRHIADIDSIILRVLPGVLRRYPLFFGRSEGRTHGEIRAQQEADVLLPDVADQLRAAAIRIGQRQREQVGRAIEAAEGSALPNTANPAPQSGNVTTEVELERIGITEAGLFIHRIITPVQDGRNRRSISQVLLDPLRDGYVQIEYNDGSRVEHLQDGTVSEITSSLSVVDEEPDIQLAPPVAPPNSPADTPPLVRRVSFQPRATVLAPAAPAAQELFIQPQNIRSISQALLEPFGTEPDQVAYVNGMRAENQQDGTASDDITLIDDEEEAHTPTLLRGLSIPSRRSAGLATAVPLETTPLIAHPAESDQPTSGGGNFFTNALKRAWMRMSTRSGLSTLSAAPSTAQREDDFMETIQILQQSHPDDREASTYDNGDEVPLPFQGDAAASAAFAAEGNHDVVIPIPPVQAAAVAITDAVSITIGSDDSRSFITASSGSEEYQQALSPTDSTSANNDQASSPETTEGTDQQAASPTSSGSSSASSLGLSNAWSISVVIPNVTTTIFQDNTPEIIELISLPKDPIEELMEKARKEDPEAYVNPFATKEDEKDNTRYDENGDPYFSQNPGKQMKSKKADVGYEGTGSLLPPSTKDYNPDRIDPTTSSRYGDPSETWETHAPIIALKRLSVINPSFKSHGYNIRLPHNPFGNEFHIPKVIGDIFHHGMDFISH